MARTINGSMSSANPLWPGVEAASRRHVSDDVVIRSTFHPGPHDRSNGRRFVVVRRIRLRMAAS